MQAVQVQSPPSTISQVLRSYKPQSSSIDTWSLVRDLFSREHYHLHQIARLEKALSSARSENHNKRAAYNNLQEQYGKLHKSYTLLYTEYQRLKRELEVCHCHFRVCPHFDDCRVEEINWWCFSILRLCSLCCSTLFLHSFSGSQPSPTVWPVMCEWYAR